ncbi:MAG: hypothetical protein ACKOC7_08990 [Sphingomonadales bacterium]
MRTAMFLVLSVGAVLLFTACQGPSDQAEQGPDQVAPQALSADDSLYHQVMDIHDEVMPKMGKVRGAQQRAQQRLDSLAKQAGSANKAYRQQLEKLVNDLNYADFAMDKWMVEFNMDSATDNKPLRVRYFQEELEKVQKVKAAILGSLAAADSLIRQ